MKKILLFALMMLAIVSCKKKSSSDDDPTTPDDPTVDVRDAFVGEYDLEIIGKALVTTTNETIAPLLPQDSMDVSEYFKDQTLTITKDPNSSNKVIIASNLYNCTALVSGNNLAFEGSTTESVNISLGEIFDIALLKGVTLPVDYTIIYQTATLSNDVLTWHTQITGKGSVNIVVMNVDLSANASINNIATKRNN